MRTPMAAKSARDMALSLAVIIVPIAVLIALLARPGDTTPKPLDYTDALARARHEASYPVLAPHDLPGGWLARKAQWTRRGQDLRGKAAAGDRWEMGWLSPDQVYFGLTQDDAPGAGPGETCPPDGERQVTALGRRWRVLEGRGRTTCLVGVDRGVTTVVSADAAPEAVRAFTDTLSER